MAVINPYYEGIFFNRTNPWYRVSKCHVQPRTIFLSLRKILRILCANYFFLHINLSLFFLNALHILCDFRCYFSTFSCPKFQNQIFDNAKKSTFILSDLVAWAAPIIIAEIGETSHSHSFPLQFS